jgi:hypothetical protein
MLHSDIIVHVANDEDADSERSQTLVQDEDLAKVIILNRTSSLLTDVQFGSPVDLSSLSIARRSMISVCTTLLTDNGSKSGGSEQWRSL